MIAAFQKEIDGHSGPPISPPELPKVQAQVAVGGVPTQRPLQHSEDDVQVTPEAKHDAASAGVGERIEITAGNATATAATFPYRAMISLLLTRISFSNARLSPSASNRCFP